MPALAVLVDLDGTLVGFDRPYEAITEAAQEAHLGAALPALVDPYREAFFDASDALAPRPYRTGMEAVLSAAGSGAEADPDAMVESLRAAEHDALTVDPAVPRALSALAADAPLGVLTNGVRAWQRAKLDHVGLNAGVAHIFGR
jgi:putative hydrolase of the HAD superfamily